MSLAITEESYLNSSLSLRPPIRPDGRSQITLRSLDAAVSILPGTNGSARIRLGDGGECIVGVKVEVELVPRDSLNSAVEVDCDIVGVQSNSPLHSLLCSTLQTWIQRTLPPSIITISHNYRYKIFVDGVILDHVSHPLTLFSMTIYLALLDTRLPLLVSNTTEVNEGGLPLFSNDWHQSWYLCRDWTPPIVQLGVVVGKNIFVDATGEETEVSDGGVMVVWHSNRVKSFKVLNTRDVSKQVFNMSIIAEAVDVLSESAKDIETALKSVVGS
ncbi:ribosomal protein S5 domain 2-type protein [Limtongia smithiae]|uniref:ribosomal protein S5 domain 2-type protein n=1 Tax=Limtongia smithiae TaxID=1125753 RepID=UPI0034CE3C97